MALSGGADSYTKCNTFPDMEVSRDAGEDSYLPSRGSSPCRIANSPPGRGICSPPSEGEGSTRLRLHANSAATVQRFAARSAVTAPERTAATGRARHGSAPAGGGRARAVTFVSRPKTSRRSRSCRAGSGASRSRAACAELSISPSAMRPSTVTSGAIRRLGDSSTLICAGHANGVVNKSVGVSQPTHTNFINTSGQSHAQGQP